MQLPYKSNISHPINLQSEPYLCLTTLFLISDSSQGRISVWIHYAESRALDKNEINYYHKLYELASDIISKNSWDKVTYSIVVGICEVIGTKGCSLMLLSPDRKTLVHSVSIGLSDAFLDAGPRSIDKSLPETVKGAGQVAAIYNLAEEKDRVQYPEAAEREGIVSILAVPVKLREDIIGELRVYSRTARRFMDDETYFIQAVANLGAIAMENIRLYESCQRAYDNNKNKPE